MSSNSLNLPTTKKSRLKVVLQPGYSQLDWAVLKNKINKQEIKRLTLKDIKNHNTKEDCWTAIMGRVYDITPYLNFHPGGVPMLLSVAGRDGTILFQKYHMWINCEAMLDRCLVGYLVQ